MPWWVPWCFASWLSISAVLAAPRLADAAPADPSQLAQARALQEEIPALRGRTDAAAERSTAARRWFAGDAVFEAAFPSLAGAPLLDPAWLSARLLTLDEAGEARAAARVAPIDPDLPEPLVARVQEARRATLDAEAEAASLERRLLLGLRSGLEDAPGLQAADLETERRSLASARQVLGIPAADARPDDPSARQILLLGEAEARLSALEVAAVQALTVPGDTGLHAFVEEDLSQLDRGSPAEVQRRTAARLRRTLPLLPTALRQRVAVALETETLAALQSEQRTLQTRREALEDGLSIAAPTPQSGSVADSERALQEAQEALRAVRDADATAAPPSTPVETARQQVRTTRLEVRRLEVEQARQALDAARRIAALGLTGQPVTKADLDAAEAAAAEAAAVAEAARQSAQDADRLVAEALEATTALGVTQVQADKDRQAGFDATQTALETRLQEAQAAREDALGLPPLARSRPQALSQAWEAIDLLVRDIRSELLGREATCGRLSTDNTTRLRSLPEAPDDVRSQAEPTLVEELDKATNAAVSRNAAGIRTCRASLATLSSLQHEAKASRRRLEAVAPRAVGRTLETSMVELWAEAEAVLVWASAEAWSLAQMRPQDLRVSLQTLLDLLFSSVELVAVFALWFLARRSTPRLSRLLMRRAAEGSRQAWAQGLAGQLEHMGVEVSPLSWRGLGPAAQPVLVCLIDVLAGSLTFVVLLQTSSFVAFPVLAWTAWQVRRLGVSVVELTLSMPSNTAVNEPVVSAETRALASRTARVLITWWVLRRVLTFASLRLLDADRITELISLLFALAGLVVATVFLVRWHERILAALGRQEPVRWTAWLPASVPALLQPAHAALALTLLVERWLSRALHTLVATRAGLAWVGAALARQRLRDAEEAHHRPLLPADVLANIRAQPVPPEGIDELREELMAEYTRWCNSDSRGMVAVVGDHGMGKSSVLTSFVEHLPSDFPVHRLAPPVLCHDAELALNWLASSCGVDLEPELPLDQRASLLALALLEQQPQVFVVDDTERLLLRTVGGYRALRRVMNILHATSGHHLWVCAMHGPTWTFLQGLPLAVNLALFRTTVELRPVGAARMASWLESQTRAAGVELSYQSLLPESTLDSTRAEARVRTAFWLLLTEESAGNRRVAMEYWLSALREGENGCAAVTRFDPPRVAMLADKPDRDLFVLTALALHDALTVNEMAESLNLAPAIVRSTSRKLESLGILAEHEDGYRITLRWQPIVGRVLRDKQFVHGG